MPKILVRKCHLVFRLGHACEFSHDRKGLHEQQITCGATSIPREGDFVSLPRRLSRRSAIGQMLCPSISGSPPSAIFFARSTKTPLS